MIKEALSLIVEGQDLTREHARDVMRAITEGDATPAQIGGLLTALRVKGEAVDEIVGFAEIMREKVTPVPTARTTIVDVVGTGGDGLNTLNVSTLSALTAAGAGAVVAKHGNRAVSSKCGSADILAALGVNLDAPVEVLTQCLDELGIAFLFAPNLHPAMKHAAGPRRDLGMRTVFNILGPMTNPAGAHCLVLGVYDLALTEPVAQALCELGVQRAFVVHGVPGMDEISTVGETRLSEVNNGKVRTFQITPQEFGLEPANINALIGGETPEEHLAIAQSVLNAEPGPARDIVILNAAATLAAAGVVESIGQGVSSARASLESGVAREKLQALVEKTNA
jgi:anthranilate phosphoribosyltransferase